MLSSAVRFTFHLWVLATEGNSNSLHVLEVPKLELTWILLLQGLAFVAIKDAMQGSKVGRQPRVLSSYGDYESYQ